MNDETTGRVDQARSGMSRREALQKGALVGGTVLWVTPLVQSVGMSPAAAQTTSSAGQGLRGISFIEFRFTCDGGTFFAKVDTIESKTDFVCDGPSPRSATCGVDKTDAQDGCGMFTLSDLVFDEGELVGLTVNLTCEDAEFLAGQSKCGQDCAGAVEASEVEAGESAMFFGCPK